jgi:1-acyl-sn-glycerol-3-phosphate acyltransferase
MSPWWPLRNIFPGPAVRCVYRPMVEGIEHLPAGGAIIASNHLSWSDPGFLQLVINRPLVFAVNVRFYRHRGLPGYLIGQFLRACDAVPVGTTQGHSAATLMRAADAAVRAGRLFCIYPEGGIARDGRIHRGHTGVGRVAASVGVPVVPVAMVNTDIVLPAVRRAPKLARVRIRIGEPMDFRGWVETTDDYAAARAITERIMQRITDLSGRTFANEYVHNA